LPIRWIISHSEIKFVYRISAGMLYPAGVARQAMRLAFHFLRIPKYDRAMPKSSPRREVMGGLAKGLSVIKAFSITETARLQFRTEFINAFNHAQFADPSRAATNSNFGKITGQSNLPRNIQFALRLVF